MKKITMQDIANQLNLSKNSVSQALGDKNGVSQHTKTLVREKAIELGYHYKKKASLPDLSSIESSSYALFATEFALSQISFFGEIQHYIEKELNKKRGELITFSISPELVAAKKLPSHFAAKDFRGLFILSHIEQEYISHLLSLNLPCVLIDHHDPHLNVDCVISQNKSGAYTAMEYLIKLGHRHIGFLGNINWSPSYEERWEGYSKAIRDYKLNDDKECAITDVLEERLTLFKQLDALSNKLTNWPTAWLCVNSGLGFILISYFQSKGYRVPDDISVCCFDNTEMTLLSHPQITTMAINMAQMGEKSVELLDWRTDHPEEPHVHLSLSTHLIERDSTSPLSAAKLREGRKQTS